MSGIHSPEILARTIQNKQRMLDVYMQEYYPLREHTPIEHYKTRGDLLAGRSIDAVGSVCLLGAVGLAKTAIRDIAGDPPEVSTDENKNPRPHFDVFSFRTGLIDEDSAISLDKAVKYRNFVAHPETENVDESHFWWLDGLEEEAAMIADASSESEIWWRNNWDKEGPILAKDTYSETEVEEIAFIRANHISFIRKSLALISSFFEEISQKLQSVDWTLDKWIEQNRE